MSSAKYTLLDCTLRDGGYYNDWDFDPALIERYLAAMSAVGVDVVEMGLRSLRRDGFRGACAYTTDEFLASLPLPATLSIGVMVNASELIGAGPVSGPLASLFPARSDDSRLTWFVLPAMSTNLKKPLQQVSGSGIGVIGSGST